MQHLSSLSKYLGTFQCSTCEVPASDCNGARHLAVSAAAGPYPNFCSTYRARIMCMFVFACLYEHADLYLCVCACVWAGMAGLCRHSRDPRCFSLDAILPSIFLERGVQPQSSTSHTSLLQVLKPLSQNPNTCTRPRSRISYLHQLRGLAMRTKAKRAPMSSIASAISGLAFYVPSPLSFKFA